MFSRVSLSKITLIDLLCLGFILLPVSNSVGQVPLYIAGVWGLIAACRGQVHLKRPEILLAALFALILVLSTFTSVRPGNSLSKLNRLLLFPILIAVPCACRIPDPRTQLLKLFKAAVLGVVLLALYDLVRIPLEVRAGTPLFHTGNMTAPQVYMIVLFLLLGLRAESGRPGRATLLLLIVLIAAGILLHNKRGVWLATLITLPVWTLWSRQWKTLLGMVLICTLAFSLPFVRERLHNVRDNLSPRHGGRYTLWEAVAPRLISQYPFGMGFNASEHEDFRAIIDQVNADLPRNARYHLEDRLRHLHNNLLQIRLELGLHGVIVWSLWMLYALWLAFRPAPRELRLLRGAIACALLALLLNGIVEYNFGNSEIFMNYLMLFGMLHAVAWPASAAAPVPAPPPAVPATSGQNTKDN